MIEIRIQAVTRLTLVRAGSMNEVADFMADFADSVAAAVHACCPASVAGEVLPVQYATYAHEIGWEAGELISVVADEPVLVGDLAQRIHAAVRELCASGKARHARRSRSGGYVWIPSRLPNRRQ